MIRKLLTIVFILVALLYGSACGLLYSQQRAMLYHPTAAGDAMGAQEVSLPVDGAVLRLHVREQAGPRALIYFGGNGEYVARNMEWLPQALPGTALYLVNYRGYAGSTGTPTEAALFADALRVYDEVAKLHPQVSIIGRSLGSGVAAYLASERPVQKLVLVTPYDSILNVARGRYPWVPVSLVLQDRYESVTRAPRITAPTLALLAETDTTIPRASSEALLAAFTPGRAQSVVIPGSDHNSIWGAPLYREKVTEFLRADAMAAAQP